MSSLMFSPVAEAPACATLQPDAQGERQLSGKLGWRALDSTVWNSWKRASQATSWNPGSDCSAQKPFLCSIKGALSVCFCSHPYLIPRFCQAGSPVSLRLLYQFSFFVPPEAHPLMPREHKQWKGRWLQKVWRQAGEREANASRVGQFSNYKAVSHLHRGKSETTGLRRIEYIKGLYKRWCLQKCWDRRVSSYAIPWDYDPVFFSPFPSSSWNILKGDWEKTSQN